MSRNTRIALSNDELNRIKEAKREVYGEKAKDRPHAEFLVEATERWARAERLGK